MRVRVCGYGGRGRDKPERGDVMIIKSNDDYCFYFELFVKNGVFTFDTRSIKMEVDILDYYEKFHERQEYYMMEIDDEGQ